ncbi:TRAP-type mannitol/chloroaromatic compound transport system substrate-binding protein [Litorivivens lipolytica]|uniref:TRAP-type mannitol/chloroaromatic compound transport system substrate-binding protein n=1 Tax=Litorivivens lipolytica TaxID=1524264 RepID=A0A7W4W7P2_9GAMM|nr:TRAP transporter substrate-binding protein DctP [Litorivivens lipolytica]MBB3048434.1 TRAP-type mannitol/chloroaromatic compound transport system substrate-binding protein [Litorivivens lipolytica]
MNSRKQSIVILLLVAALVSLFWLYVGEQAEDFSSDTLTASGNQRVYHWKLVTSWPKNYPGLGTAPENFAKAVKEMSGGRLLIKVYGGGELVPPLGVFDAVSLGSVEMGHSAAYYWKGKMPAAPFFTSVPFGMTAQEMNGWLHYGGGLELWREVYAPFNVIPLAGGNTGVQMAGWFNKEINSVDDLKGLKMRIPGVGGEVFSRAGGTAVTLPGGELYTSLQTGVIDATEWVAPYNDMALGLHEVARYYYYPGWHEPGPTLEITVNKKAFESLPKDLQRIVEIAARYANQDMLDEYTARNNAALNRLLDQHDIQVKKLPNDVLRHLRKAAYDYYGEVTESDPTAKKVYQSWKKFLDGASNYHRISEQAYINTRDLEE